MPRRRRVDIREVLPDPVFNSTLVEKFICSMMWDGKKTVAQGIFYVAMEKIRERTSERIGATCELAPGEDTFARAVRDTMRRLPRPLVDSGQERHGVNTPDRCIEWWRDR